MSGLNDTVKNIWQKIKKNWNISKGVWDIQDNQNNSEYEFWTCWEKPVFQTNLTKFVVETNIKCYY